MWIYLLVGLGVGVLAVMFTVLRQEKRYRVLFSDTHLTALAEAVDTSRRGDLGTTFEGLTVSYHPLPKHLALRIRSAKPIAKPAARFLLAFVDALVRGEARVHGAGEARAQGDAATRAEGDTDACHFLSSGNTMALVWSRESGVDLEHGSIAFDADRDSERIGAVRAVAADRMRDLVVVEGTLEAYA